MGAYRQYIVCDRKITAVSAALKFAKISHYNKESNNGPEWHTKR
jgi:hypothetical protein